ncbi:MBL fold metallo-hydrolase [bacterium]|nr:MBL fold metallo-hydrolase [candidate division CSSED10-310 bacterium]
MILDTVVIGPLDVNCYLIGSKSCDELVVVDPGGCADLILRKIRLLNKRVKAVIATHGHFDHIGAIKTITDFLKTEFWFHQDDLALLRSAPSQALFFGIDGVQIQEPTRFLKNGDRFVLGDLQFRVVHCPGHSPGSICILCEALNYAITGDTLFRESIGRTDLPGGNTEQLLQSILNNLLSLPDSTQIFPGHGFPTTILHEKQSNPFFF